MRKMVKAVHFESGAEMMEEEDQGGEPSIRPRVGTGTSKNEAQIPEYIIEEAWKGEGDILEIVKEEMPALKEHLGAEGEEQLRRYLGIRAETLAETAVSK